MNITDYGCWIKIDEFQKRYAPTQPGLSFTNSFDIEHEVTTFKDALCLIKHTPLRYKTGCILFDVRAIKHGKTKYGFMIIKTDNQIRMFGLEFDLSGKVRIDKIINSIIEAGKANSLLTYLKENNMEE